MQLSFQNPPYWTDKTLLLIKFSLEEAGIIKVQKISCVSGMQTTVNVAAKQQ